jgi:hypothetical protein
MKQTSQIGPVVAGAILALGLVATAGTAAAADATKPTYNGAPPRSTDSSSSDYHANSNGNDYHANYHADYSATQDGRPSQPLKAGEQLDPRADDRRFQDGEGRPGAALTTEATSTSPFPTPCARRLSRGSGRRPSPRS